MEYIQKQILTDSIYINPKDINVKNINGIILLKLKELKENKCNSNGIILKNSIKLIKKNIGKISTIDTYSKLVYNVKYECLLINPTNGDKIECYIDNISKMGIIAYIKMNEYKKKYKDTLDTSPLIIIIPIDNVLNIKKYNVDDKIEIEVVASRIKYNSDKIQIIGKM